MNTPNNRRRKASRERIEGAFMHLLERLPIEKIRVSAVCELAGVNRTTFYANFLDIYDLAEQLGRGLEERVWALTPGGWIEWGKNEGFLRLFECVRENQRIFLTYFRLGFDGQRREYEYDRSLAMWLTEKVEYHITFFRAGMTAVLKRWLEGGCRETPEELCEIIRMEYAGREPMAHTV